MTRQEELDWLMMQARNMRPAWGWRALDKYSDLDPWIESDCGGVDAVRLVTASCNVEGYDPGVSLYIDTIEKLDEAFHVCGASLFECFEKMRKRVRKHAPECHAKHELLRVLGEGS